MNAPENSFHLLQQALSGDRDAWERLFAHLWPVAVASARSICDAATVEDIAQNAFVRIMENDANRLRRFSPERGSLENYIAKITRNCAVDYVRSQSKRFQDIDLTSYSEMVAPEDPLPILEEWEIMAALSTLTPRERQTIILLYQEDMTTNEAAKKMGIGTDSIRSTKSHALGKLRKFFVRE